MELSPVVKEIRLKENPYIKSNKGRGGISQRTHPSKLQTHEKQLKINQGNKLPKRENWWKYIWAKRSSSSAKEIAEFDRFGHMILSLTSGYKKGVTLHG